MWSLQRVPPAERLPGRTVILDMSNAWETDYYYHAPFAEVVASFAKANARDRRRHLAVCEKAFAGRSVLEDSIRVAAAKVLVALLPESLAALRRWLAKPGTKAVCEIHFSLFCFLDEVQNSPRLVSVKSTVLDMICGISHGGRKRHGSVCLDGGRPSG